MNGFRTVLAVVIAGVIVPFAGCGSAGGGTAPSVASASHHDLEEISRIYRTYHKGRRPPPTSEADLARYEKGFPLGIGAIKRKAILVCWGGGLSDGGDAASTVLAYEKTVPDSGGAVLMQDGNVRTMTAEEFKAAPKAK